MARVIITEQGPTISEAELATLEEQLGTHLPDDYRAFLLETDGGRPDPDTVDVPGLSDSPTGVQEFFGIHGTRESSRIRWNLTTYESRLESGHLPIAVDSFGNIFCLSLRPDERGGIIYYDLQSVYANYQARAEVYPVALDFNSFLEQLRPFP